LRPLVAEVAISKDFKLLTLFEKQAMLDELKEYLLDEPTAAWEEYLYRFAKALPDKQNYLPDQIRTRRGQIGYEAWFNAMGNYLAYMIDPQKTKHREAVVNARFNHQIDARYRKAIEVCYTRMQPIK